MEFKNWINRDQRIESLLCQLVENGINLPGLVTDINESALSRLRKRFGDNFQAYKDKVDRGEYNSWDDPVYLWRKMMGYGKQKQATPTPVAAKTPEPELSPEQKLDQLGGDLQRHTQYGYKNNDPAWKAHYDSIRAQINALSGDQSKEVSKRVDSPTPVADNSTPVADNPIQKAKAAIATLRSILKKPEFEQVLNSLEQEVSTMNKPKWYHDMTGNEKKWYDNLGDKRSAFDSEMEKSGNQSINHGDADWDFVANRAAKSAQQGYQDQGANWNWAAGLANRNRIRRSIDPSAAASLQGESSMFKDWYNKRLMAEMGPANAAGNSGVAADRPGEVMAPSDPKEIARRKAVSTLTGNMMKKNPQLKPGGTDQTMAANLATDPTVAKTDPETQQAVMNFFLKK